MERNTRVAKQLIRIARELVSMAKFTDGLGEDSDNSNSANDRQYEEILHTLYPDDVAQGLISMGYGVDNASRMSGGHQGTMGNGNMYMKYETFPRDKTFVIMGFVSKENHLTENDKQDVYNLFKFLEEQVENGYTITTGCNRYSLPFLTAFAKKNGYYFNAGQEYNEFGNADLNDNNLSRNCICRKRKPTDRDNGNLDQLFSTDSKLDRVQRRREQGLMDIVNQREGK